MTVLIIIIAVAVLFLLWQGKKVAGAVLDNQHPQFISSLDDLEYDEDMKERDFDQTVQSARRYVENDFNGRNRKLMKTVARNRSRGRTGIMARRLEKQLETEEAIRDMDKAATPYRLKATRINPKTGYNQGSRHNYYKRARIGERLDGPESSGRSENPAKKSRGLLKKIFFD